MRGGGEGRGGEGKEVTDEGIKCIYFILNIPAKIYS